MGPARIISTDDRAVGVMGNSRFQTVHKYLPGWLPEPRSPITCHIIIAGGQGPVRRDCRTAIVSDDMLDQSQRRWIIVVDEGAGLGHHPYAMLTEATWDRPGSSVQMIELLV